MKIKFTLIFALSLNVILFAQNLNGRFSSSIYMFERFDSIDVSKIT